MTTAHDFEVTTADGGLTSLGEYAGKVVLIVNTASKCGLTPQYDGLEELYRARKDQGLVILGFPCNQFAGQEPGSDADIQDFCRVTYDVTFPVFAKVDVNGPTAAPLFRFLRTEQPGDAAEDDIRWNFTKFLVDRDGAVVGRYEPTVLPADIDGDLDKYL